MKCKQLFGDGHALSSARAGRSGGVNGPASAFAKVRVGSISPERHHLMMSSVYSAFFQGSVDMQACRQHITPGRVAAHDGVHGGGATMCGLHILQQCMHLSLPLSMHAVKVCTTMADLLGLHGLCALGVHMCTVNMVHASSRPYLAVEAL